MRLTSRVVVLLLLLVTGAIAQQQQNPEEYAKFLEGAERVQRMQVPSVVAVLGLKPGMKVADIGSGSGLFTRPIPDLSMRPSPERMGLLSAFERIYSRLVSNPPGLPVGCDATCSL